MLLQYSKKKTSTAVKKIYNLLYKLISYLFINYKCNSTAWIVINTAYWKSHIPKTQFLHFSSRLEKEVFNGCH